MSLAFVNCGSDVPQGDFFRGVSRDVLIPNDARMRDLRRSHR